MPNFRTRSFIETEDADAVSSYPSNTIAVNLSNETTEAEIIDMKDIPKEVFKYNNINLMFGPVNTVSYCNEMLNLPTMYEVYKKLKKEKLIT